VRTIIVLGALCLAVASPCGAATHFVNPEGTGDFPTIQAAVDAAAVGDTIRLAEGTYTGDRNRDIDFGGKDLVLDSEAQFALTCEIDCEGSIADPHRGFHFHSGETRAAQVRNIMIRNGYDHDTVTHLHGGGGLRIDGASPTISGCYVVSCVVSGGAGLGGGVSIVGGASPLLESCVIAFCDVEGYGAGVGVYSSRPSIVGCHFAGNTTEGVGGGLYAQNAFDMELEDCLFGANVAGVGGGARIGGSGGVVVERCRFEANEATFAGRGDGGGGVLLDSAILLNCTVVGNSATGIGGGVLCKFSDSATLTNCIVAGNTGGAGVACYAPTDVMTLSCCDVWDNVGGNYGANMTDQTGVSGNISTDPLFCDAALSVYTLDAASPCAPANNSCGVYMGSEIVGCDSPVTHATWGAVKALFKR